MDAPEEKLIALINLKLKEQGSTMLFHRLSEGGQNGWLRYAQNIVNANSFEEYINTLNVRNTLEGKSLYTPSNESEHDFKIMRRLWTSLIKS